MRSLFSILNAIAACFGGPLLGLCGGQVTVTWDPPPNPAVAGFYLCWGASSGVYTFTNIYASDHIFGTVDNIADGQVCFFAVQAFLSNGVVSPFSNEASLGGGAPSTNSTSSESLTMSALSTDDDESDEDTGGKGIAAPVIQSASRSGSSFTFTWNTAASLTYQVQYTTNLAQNGWINVGDSFVATNATASLTATLASPQMFYRVRMVPP